MIPPPPPPQQQQPSLTSRSIVELLQSAVREVARDFMIFRAHKNMRSSSSSSSSGNYVVIGALIVELALIWSDVLEPGMAAVLYIAFWRAATCSVQRSSSNQYYSCSEFWIHFHLVAVSMLPWAYFRPTNLDQVVMYLLAALGGAFGLQWKRYGISKSFVTMYYSRDDRPIVTLPAMVDYLPQEPLRAALKLAWHSQLYDLVASAIISATGLRLASTVFTSHICFSLAMIMLLVSTAITTIDGAVELAVMYLAGLDRDGWSTDVRCRVILSALHAHQRGQAPWPALGLYEQPPIAEQKLWMRATVEAWRIRTLYMDLMLTIVKDMWQFSAMNYQGARYVLQDLAAENRNAAAGRDLAWLKARGARQAEKWWGAADTTCAVCLAPLAEGGAVSSFPCGCCTMGENDGEQQQEMHVFHAKCIVAWITKQATCPLCRSLANGEKGNGEKSDDDDDGEEEEGGGSDDGEERESDEESETTEFDAVTAQHMAFQAAQDPPSVLS